MILQAKYGVVLALMFWSAAAWGQSAASSIKVVVEGVRNDQGQVGILLFRQAQGFPSDHQAAMRQELVPARKGRVEASFDGLPAGTYAIAVMHDENKNLKIDTNILGIPKEGYGVSNNVKNLMRAPRFAEAAFELRSGRSAQTIQLIY